MLLGAVDQQRWASYPEREHGDTGIEQRQAVHVSHRGIRAVTLANGLLQSLTNPKSDCKNFLQIEGGIGNTQTFLP